MDLDLDLIIAAWLDEFEDGKLPRSDADRVEAFMMLLKTLKEKHSYKSDGLALVKSKVLIRCTNDSVGPTRHTRWKSMLETLFNTATIRIWRQEILKPSEEEKNPAKIKFAEAPPKPVPTAEEALEQIKQEHEELPRLGREMDQSLRDKFTMPTIIYDEEFLELMGLKSNG